VIIRQASISDREDIAELYKTVAVEGNVVGISRRPHEITDTYVYSLLNRKPADIVCLVGVDDDDRVIGLVHGTKNGLEVYSHILGDLTVIVSPDHQSKGIAKKLSLAFLEHIFNQRTDIMRVEMEVITILKLVQAFELAGFVKEAETSKRIKNGDGTFSNSVLMAWFNPNFKG
jgi:ribosomal protein S18 acetylase RimI-like enzyme